MYKLPLPSIRYERITSSPSIYHNSQSNGWRFTTCDVQKQKLYIKVSFPVWFRLITSDSIWLNRKVTVLYIFAWQTFRIRLTQNDREFIQLDTDEIITKKWNSFPCTDEEIGKKSIENKWKSNQSEELVPLTLAILPDVEFQASE